ncbi:MAG: CoA-binding protein [Actinobacteria bacterium]|nr:CoA-binding protein [Actinomycetota bacterium]
MTPTAPTNDEIRKLLLTTRTIAIVGVSGNSDKASNHVARYLQGKTQYELFFVNPAADEILGQKVYKSLSEIEKEIDLVDVFRKPDDCLAVLDEAIAINAKAIWLQLGISVPEVAAQGEAAGLTVVMDRCIKVDHANLLRDS